MLHSTCGENNQKLILPLFTLEQKKYKCRQTCNIHSVDIDCSARLPKKFRKYAKPKQAVVTVKLEMEIDSLPLKGR